MKFEVQDLTYARSQNFRLGPLSFALEPGQILAVLGENGSGKSTLLSNLLLEPRPNQGQITLGQTDLKTLSPQRKAQKIALVPQSPQIELDFTVHETVLLGRTPYATGIWESDQDQKIVQALQTRLNLDTLKNKLLSQISGGERQRTLIARALAQEPQVLLLDEPTAHLDVRYHQDLSQIVCDLRRQGLIQIVTSHDLNWIAPLADQVLFLKNGQPVAYGPAQKTMDTETLQRVFGVPFQRLSGSQGQTVFLPSV